MSFVEVLKEKRERITQEIADIRQSMAAMASKVAVGEAQLRNIEELLAIEGEPIERLSSPDSIPTFDAPKLTDHAYEVLSTIGQPLHYRELTRRLQDAGVFVAGQDPPANLLAQYLA